MGRHCAFQKKTKNRRDISKKSHHSVRCVLRPLPEKLEKQTRHVEKTRGSHPRSEAARFPKTSKTDETSRKNSRKPPKIIGSTHPEKTKNRRDIAKKTARHRKTRYPPASKKTRKTDETSRKNSHRPPKITGGPLPKKRKTDDTSRKKRKTP